MWFPAFAGLNIDSVWCWRAPFILYPWDKPAQVSPGLTKLQLIWTHTVPELKLLAVCLLEYAKPGTVDIQSDAYMLSHHPTQGQSCGLLVCRKNSHSSELHEVELLNLTVPTTHSALLKYRMLYWSNYPVVIVVIINSLSHWFIIKLLNVSYLMMLKHHWCCDIFSSPDAVSGTWKDIAYFSVGHGRVWSNFRHWTNAKYNIPYQILI